MKITKVDIPGDPATGLTDIKMSRLGQVVIIAGKNGSGKSRILTKIKNTLKKKHNKSAVDEATNKKIEITDALKSYKRQLTQPIGIDAIPGQQEAHRKRINKQIVDTEKKLKNLEAILSWNLIETSDSSNQYEYIDFVPKGLTLHDCNNLTKNDLKNGAANIENTIGLAEIQGFALAKIQHVQDQWVQATHPDSKITESERNKKIADYTKLCEYIKIFINASLERDGNDDATLFGFRIGDARLSDGQIILLQFCVAIYSQEKKLSELIIFLDEPENHLHPKALMEVIDKLCSAVPNGQIWIATHSINLLAHFDPSSIWYMENGGISYAGNKPQHVLTGLLGNDDEIAKLADFLSLPAQMASNQFAFECLFNPTSVSTGTDDPQTKQIIDAIDSLRTKGQKLKILDFGAGKGRLLSTIKELQSKEQLNEWLDYYAYDPSSADAIVCQQIIADVYPNENRYFNESVKLLEHISKHSFDLIIMCNVFHEIDPRNWLALFSEHEIIRYSLKADGILLVVEDQLIAAGEKAYQNGFLVFDKLQFKELFGVEGYKVLTTKEDRLRAHFLPANCLGSINSIKRAHAIKNLNATAKQKITELRAAEPTYKNGRLHGFWVQQLANTALALSELDTPS